MGGFFCFYFSVENSFFLPVFVFLAEAVCDYVSISSSLMLVLGFSSH